MLDDEISMLESTIDYLEKAYEEIKDYSSDYSEANYIYDDIQSLKKSLKKLTVKKNEEYEDEVKDLNNEYMRSV